METCIRATNPSISVVIPSYGPTPYLRSLVDSLNTQTVRPLEIIIAHSGSCDPTEWLHDSEGGVTVIHSRDRWLPGAARNAGAIAAKGEWLAFIDSDVIAEKAWLEGFSVATCNYTQPVVFVGSLNHGPEDGYWGRCLWFIEFGSVHPYRVSHLMASAPGANLMLPRDAFEQVEGFPVDMFVAEDALFFIRLQEMGYNLVFTPEARASHQCISDYSHFMPRLFKLGEGAAHIRLARNLPGSLAAKVPPLALGLWLARYMQICKRVVESRGPIIKLLVHTPGILLGLLSWSGGFFKRSITGHQGSANDESERE